MAKRVYFAFHYQDVKDFRANVVRNHWLLKDDREAAGFFDSSLWEKAKTEGAAGLKRIINAGLDGTTVTCVLIGSGTYARPWVRYEIMKSMKRGNKLFGVHINGIADKNQQTKASGPNPFDFLAYSYNTAGTRLSMLEHDGMAWVNYTGIDGAATYEVSGVAPGGRGQAFKLSATYPVYLWDKHNGYENFNTWVS
jgi:hypothetical protein